MSESLSDNLHVLSAFKDTMSKDQDLVEALRKYKGEIQILHSGNDSKTASTLAESFNSIVGSPKIMVKTLDDMILPGQTEINVGFEHARKGGIAILLVPIASDSVSREVSGMGKFIRGAIGDGRATKTGYLLISPSTERVSLAADYIRENRLNLDNNQHTDNAIASLKSMLTRN